MSKQISIQDAMALAAQYARDGQHEAARKLLKQIVALEPGNKEARKALKKLPRSKDRSSDFRSDMEQLMLSYEGEPVEQTLALARRLSKKHPSQPMPRNIEGALLTATGNYAAAEAPLREAIELDENYAGAWNNLGAALRRLDRTDEALAAFNKALAITPNDADALYNMAGVLRESGRLAEAIDAYDKAIDIRPGHPPSHCEQGMTIRMIGRAHEAVPCLKNAIDLSPDYVEAHEELGEAFLLMGMFTAAVEELETAARLNPDSAYTNYRLGFAHYKAGDTESAIKAYERSLEIAPDTPGVLHFLNIAKGTTPETAPEGYVQQLFDEFAPRFENSLVDQLGYDGPAKLLAMMETYSPGRKYQSGVDLGCGTGLFGLELRPRVEKLIGVDLSAKMLEQASKKGVYDELLQTDMVSALSGLSTSPDLVGAADVLIYLGDLQPVLQAISDTVSAGADITFSTELLDGDGDYQLLETGRYAHSDAYVKRTAEAVGLEIVGIEHSRLRKESASWLTGGYYFMRKPA